MGEKMKDTTCCPKASPVTGDVYVCSQCRMTVTITRGCPSTNADPECCCLACCGLAMDKVN